MRPDASFWNEVEEIFEAVLIAEEPDRSEILRVRCSGRVDLQAAVESLLAAHERAGSSMVTPSFGPAQRAAGEGPAFPGMRVGAFRLGHLIARGGMGKVFKAERAEGDFQQQVAVKVIAARLAGTETLDRFRTERQILARLQHPNIVALLDGGVTENGQPYLVMEYVDGLSITEFCSRKAAPLETRLNLFRQLCAAVDFAHRHLIVHRDLKPANVLVAQDTVKVLDFGIAKLLDEEGTSLATAPLLTPMTPNYASPEQLRGVPVTTAADIYALGVILYELISGIGPYETARKSLDEVIDIVVKRDPVRPSAVAATTTLPYSRRRLAGDLDAIVLRAMAKDPGQRYASAAELSEDVARFLKGAPVVAREPSFAYLVRKTVARHRAAFAVAAVSVVLLLAAVVGALWQARVAARERERAVQRFNDVRELAGSLIFKIHDEVAPLPGSTPVRRTVVAEGLKFLERLERDAGGDGALQLDLAKAYIRIGVVQGKKSEANLGDVEGARRSFRRALALVDAARVGPERQAEATRTHIDAHLSLSETLGRAQKLTVVRTAHDLAAAWYAREPSSIDAAEQFARATFYLAEATPDPDSLALWLDCDRLYKQLLTRNPDDPKRIRAVALTQKYMATFYQRAGDTPRTLMHAENALALDRRRVTATPDERAALIDLAIDITIVAQAHQRMGSYENAIVALRESLAIREKISEADPKDIYAQGRVAYAHAALADAYLAAGERAAAREHALKSIARCEPLLAISPAYGLDQAYAFLVMAGAAKIDGDETAACAWYEKGRRAYQGTDLPLRARYSIVAMIEEAVASCGRR